MITTTHDETIRGARIHSLDAYRGVLMILGIVIHGALPFMHGGDPVSNGVVRFSFWSVHLFRMPAFFVLCGFFGALLWQRYGAAGMLMNRFERIALPLVICVSVAPFVILYPVFLIERWFNHSDNVPAHALASTLKEISQIIPHHLWFLYYLVFITFGIAWWIQWQLKRGKDWSGFGNRIRQFFEHPWRFVVILSTLHVLLLVCALLIDPIGRVTVPADGSTWALNPATLLYYSLFYGLGWILFTSETDLSKSRDSAFTLISIGLVCVLGHTLFFEGYDADPFNLNKPNVEQFCLFLLLLINWSVALFAISRGLMGLFYRYTSNESYLWRYVSDASYWIYLIHLVFALHLKDFSRPFNLPTVMDFGLTIVMTCLIGFVSYDLFIRSTWMGRFLNGRRYARFGWRLNGPGLTCIVVFFGGSLIPAVPSLKTERHWIERGESLSQIPFDLQSDYEKSMSMDTQNSEVNEQCKRLGRYAFCEMDADRRTAQQLCHAMGARLPVFSNQAESEGVSKAAYGMHVWGSWLGITDAQTEGTWVEDGGRPITYENWHEGEPNDYGSGEDCAVFYSPGHWNDEGCTNKRNFVCQFEARITPSERALCKDLTQRIDNWIKQEGENGQGALIAHSIKAQCSSATHSIGATPNPLGEPIAALSGLWIPDLERIWQEPEFKNMSSHHKTWAKGYLHVGGYRVIFGRNELAFIYTHTTEDKRITIPYSIESNLDRTLVLRAGRAEQQKRYTLTIEDNGIIIEDESTLWALKRKMSAD